MARFGSANHYYPTTTQTVTVGAASAQITNPVGSQIYVVRIVSSTDCHAVFGTNPTATTNDMAISANREEYFSIKPGQKVAFIQNSAGGTAFVTEMTQ